MTYQTLFNSFREALSSVLEETEAHSIFFIVIEHFTGMSRTQFYMNNQQQVPDSLEQNFYKIMSRLKKGEPIQYILHEAWFLERKFYVDHNVLIPRSETEEIIGIIKNRAPKAKSVIDIGTGSGCIAISLNRVLDATVWAMDYNDQVLDVARKNAKINDADVCFFKDDILNPARKWEQPFDVIVSNPPYVKMSEKNRMQKNVLDFEPGNALFVTDNDPLIYYKAILLYAQNYLSAKGTIVLEINESLSTETKTLFGHSFQKVESVKDIHNKERFVIATNNKAL